MEHTVKVEYNGKFLSNTDSLCVHLCKYFQTIEYTRAFPPTNKLKMKDKRALDHYLTLYTQTFTGLADIYQGAKIKVVSIRTYHPTSTSGKVAKRKIHLKVTTK